MRSYRSVSSVGPITLIGFGIRVELGQAIVDRQRATEAGELDQLPNQANA